MLFFLDARAEESRVGKHAKYPQHRAKSSCLYYMAEERRERIHTHWRSNKALIATLPVHLIATMIAESRISFARLLESLD